MKKIILAVAVAALAVMAVASSASAGGVDRYQTKTGTLTVSTAGNAYVHTYTININPCDNTFSGTGGIALLGLKENVRGTLNGPNIALISDYTTYNTPYTYFYDGPLNGVGNGHDTINQAAPLTSAFAATDQSNFKNHGEYVSSQGGGSDAAHSCIGMPVR